MYASLSQFKDYIGICQADTEKDSELQLLLDSAGNQINKLCGVDSFLSRTYEEDIDIRKIYTNAFGYNLFLKNKPVSAIIQINNNAYTGEKGVDYMVANQRRVIFKEFDYEAPFGFINIEYIAGYSGGDIPDDLRLIEMMIACGNLPESMKLEHNIGVSSYKLGDEQIVLGSKSSTGTTADDNYFSFRMMLDKFKNFTLAI